MAQANNGNKLTDTERRKILIAVKANISSVTRAINVNTDRPAIKAALEEERRDLEAIAVKLQQKELSFE